MDKTRVREGREKLKETSKGNIKVMKTSTSKKSKFESQANDDIGRDFSLLLCCQKIQNEEELFTHIKGHQDNKDSNNCTFCLKKLSSKNSLNRHLLTHARWKPYKCCFCSKRFSTNGNMHRHRKNHILIQGNTQILKENIMPNERIISSKKTKTGLKIAKNKESLFLNMNIPRFLKKREKGRKSVVLKHTTSNDILLQCSSENVDNRNKKNQNESKECMSLQMAIPGLNFEVHISNHNHEENNFAIPDLSLSRSTKQEFVSNLDHQDSCRFAEIPCSNNQTSLKYDFDNEKSLSGSLVSVVGEALNSESRSSDLSFNDLGLVRVSSYSSEEVTTAESLLDLSQSRLLNYNINQHEYEALQDQPLDLSIQPMDLRKKFIQVIPKIF